MSEEQTIFVVDDEPDVRAALGMLIKSVGLKPEIYESPQAYLQWIYKSAWVSACRFVNPL